jgi:hypothetical protein
MTPSFLCLAGIQSTFRNLFQNVHFSSYIASTDLDSPHIIARDGGDMWASGGWNLTLQETMGDPIPLKGYWSEIDVRDDDDLKVRMQTWNITRLRQSRMRRGESPSN